MEKVKQIPGALMDWIIKTLNSGVNPEAIVDAMIRKGYDPRLSYTTLFRIVGNKPIDTPGVQAPYEYEQPEIAKKGSILRTKDREIKVLSKVEKPFILHLDQFLSDEECEQLIELSRSRLKPSTVIDPKTGEEKAATGRTSKGMSFYLRENEFIKDIETRISELTEFPVENGEGLQVLNYGIGEEYKSHFDYFPPGKVDPEKGGQRVGTFLIYLNDVLAGGETVFPKAGVSIVPKRGSAVYFQYGNSKGEVDRMSLHSSVPVSEGEKWVATKWIRQGNIYTSAH
ncbi:2-oxoglutarate-dependent dioxygenase [Bacillus timonensis]|uniref:2-oxoglutarate-dependent dioxygenase n=1 Tax=Bacillus timonensis TaxID=1033734 RepID=A0A4S3PVX0_9BACI|nr:2OG-Fe(II) oxygenase [Bacillus timonensis]THE13112.1 2-oxoglutarate-dependent dioxygenase [Bacillus timonensis]